MPHTDGADFVLTPSEGIYDGIHAVPNHAENVSDIPLNKAIHQDIGRRLIAVVFRITAPDVSLLSWPP